MKVLIRKYALLATVVCLALFYCLNLPQYVQGGDCGELVSAAYRLLVAHPPGYPLWLWLQHGFIHLVPFGSVFWRASLLSAFFACSTLVLVGLPLRRSTFGVLVCGPILALSRAFIAAALIPDVFSFHALFVAAIGSLYLFSKSDSKYFQIGVPFLFCLGMAHHLTTIFLFPVVIGVLFELRKNRTALRYVALAGGLGVFVTCLLYGSMLMFDTESSFSWGMLKGPGSVWRHFLRTDYGTFRLAAEEKSGTLAGLWFFFRSSWLELCGLFGIAAIALFNSKKALFEVRTWIWGATCMLGIAFFFFANVTPVGMGEEVLRRFSVMPIVQLTFLVAFLVLHANLKGRHLRAAGFLVMIVIAVQGLRAFDFVGLHQDSVFEDYASNLLAQAKLHSPALILTGNDNAYFGMKYVQAVLEKNQDIVVASPSLFFHPWYLKKIQLVASIFQLSNAEKIWSTRSLEIDKDLIEPNFHTFSVVVSKGYQDGKRYHTTFLGLGRILRAGSGVDYDDKAAAEIQLRTLLKGRPVGPQSFSKGLLFAEYSHFFLGRGLASFAAGRTDEALRDWKSALNKVPYAFPALSNLCRISDNTDPSCTESNMTEVREEADGFF